MGSSLLRLWGLVKIGIGWALPLLMGGRGVGSAGGVLANLRGVRGNSGGLMVATFLLCIVLIVYFHYSVWISTV